MKSHFLRGAPLLATAHFWHEQADGSVLIESRQDVEAIVDANKAQYADTDERARWGTGRHVARIPLTIYFDLHRRGILEDDAAMKRWLNDPDNRAFRTFPGKV